MSRYIDAELLKDRIKYHDNTTGCDRKPTKNEREIFAEVTIETLIEWVDRCPEADVVPVVHAHWENSCGKLVRVDSDGCLEDSCHCSNCGDWLTGSDEYACRGNYCPNCGAKMDEESQDA